MQSERLNSGAKAVASETRRPFVLLADWSAFEFLISLLLLIVATPFVEDLRHGAVVEAILLTFMLAPRPSRQKRTFASWAAGLLRGVESGGIDEMRTNLARLLATVVRFESPRRVVSL
jgi:hypothetical protein